MSTDGNQPYGYYGSPEEAALNGCYFLGKKHEINCVSVEPCPYACAGYSIPGETPFLASFINKDGQPAKMLVTAHQRASQYPPGPPEELMCHATPKPIFLTSGTKYIKEVDHVVGGASSFTFSRIYLSTGMRAAGLGPGWSHNYHGKVNFTPAVEYGIDTAVVDLGDGWTRSFVRPKSAWMAVNSGDYLEQGPNGWVLKVIDKDIVYDFDNFGRLAKKTFSNNRVEWFEYLGGNRLARVFGDL